MLNADLGLEVITARFVIVGWSSADSGIVALRQESTLVSICIFFNNLSLGRRLASHNVT